MVNKKSGGSGGKGKMSAIRGRYGDISVPIVGLIWALMIAVSLFSQPSFDIVNHVVVLNQGVIAPALIMGTIVWAIIELFSSAGRNIWQLLGRSFVGFIIGLIVGGFLGYEFNFGSYVILAVYSGNGAALYFMASIFTFSMVIVADAAFAHRRQFIGAAKRYVKNGKKYAPIVLGLPLSSTNTTSTMPSGASIFNQIWNALFQYLFTPILSGAGTMFQGIFAGFTSGLDIMFQGWGFSLSQYGIWGPLMVVVSISLALFVGYLMFDAIGIERDILGGEEAV